MARLATALALCAGARAYVAPVAPKAVVARSAFYGGGESGALDNLEGAPPGPVPNVANPGGAWDPLNLADTTEFGPTLEWYRAAELKHCRVAMAAFAGCVVTGLGVHWPGAIDMSGTTFESLGQGGLLEAWDKMPFDGKQAIVAAIGGIESVFEAQKPHYVMGGTPGKVRLTGTTKGALEDKYDAATLKKKRDMELANGRLAMLGMAGFVSARLTEGSVPALTKLGFAADYAGNLPYAPF